MHPSDLIPAPVTVADLYRELVALRTDNASMLSELRVMAIRSDDQRADIADHEARIRQITDAVPRDINRRVTAVERWQWRAAGIATAVAAVAGIVSGILAQVAGHGG